jgi:hypothetical protein
MPIAPQGQSFDAQSAMINANSPQTQVSQAAKGRRTRQRIA